MSEIELENGTNGLKSAVEMAHDPAAKVPDDMDAEQLALLPLRNNDQGKEAAERKSLSGRGAGRPPGAKNKSTKAWTNYLLKKYPSPLEGLASIAFRPLPDLVAELMEMTGASANSKGHYERYVEMLKIQMGAMKELAPYLHQKQPMAIQGAENGLVNLIIGGAAAGSVKTSDADKFEMEIIDINMDEKPINKSVENQGVSGNENQNSNGSDSNGLDQDIETIEELGVGLTD